MGGEVILLGQADNTQLFHLKYSTYTLLKKKLITTPLCILIFTKHIIIKMKFNS